METFECILKRKSIRKYKDIKVKEEDIKKILEAAMAAPSALNMQPWEFFVVENETVQDKIRKVGVGLDRNSTLMIVVCGNKERFILKDDINDFWPQDLSAAIENMLLEATNLGLGSLWSGLYPRMDRSVEVKNILNIEGDIYPLAVVHFGYMDEEKEGGSKYNESKVHYIK